MSEQKYFSILTEYGKQVMLDAYQGGPSIQLTTMAVGWGDHDSGNGGYEPNETDDTELRHRWGSVPLDSLRRDPDNKDLLIATGILNNDFVCEIGGPAKGHWINEVALLDNHDDTVAICSWPATYKPILEEGSATKAIIKIIIEVSDSDHFELLIDNSIALVTQEEFAEAKEEIRISLVHAIAALKAELLEAMNSLEIDTSGLAPLESPEFTGIPTVPTPPLENSADGQIANVDYVNTMAGMVMDWANENFTGGGNGGNGSSQSGPPYSITFDAVSGVVSPSSSLTDHNGSLLFLPTPTKTNYAFNGWFTEASGGSAITLSTVFTEDTIIYAQWTQNVFTITFNAGGGIVSPTSSSTGTNGKLTSLPTPTKDGHEFKGWFTTSNGSTTVATSKVYTADTTIYAQWIDMSNVMGVRWQKNQSLTTLTRLYGSVGKTFTPAVSNAGGSSGFDDMPIYQNIRLCNVVNGAVTKYKGENGFSTTPTTGDVMVEIPKFYYKIVDSTNTRDYLICATQPDNTWHISPRHAPTTAKPAGYDKIYVSAYTLNSAYRSISGNVSQVSITRATARSQINGRDTTTNKYQPYDYTTYCTIWLLYLVEVANWDSQAAVGHGNVNTSAQINTGSTDNIAFHSGSPVASNVLTSGVKYRHMENLWGNLYQFVDGINFNNKQAYLCSNPGDYADNTTNNYTAVSYVNYSVSGEYIKSLGYDSNYPYAQMCTEGGGAEGTYIPDRYYCGDGWRVLLVGGTWSNGAQSGLFCFNASYASSLATPSLGCRLLVLP